MAWRVEERPLRSPQPHPGTLTEELLFTARQIATGHEEGLALVTEYDGNLLALAVATPDLEHGVLRLIDVRVDYDYRRQGMGTALGYMISQHARERQLRAVAAETTSDNLLAARYLTKLGFQLAGLDTRRNTNHDLVKERATLLWYAEVEPGT